MYDGTGSAEERFLCGGEVRRLVSCTGLLAA